jgi:hypothetical protein
VTGDFQLPKAAGLGDPAFGDEAEEVEFMGVRKAEERE